MDIEKLRREYLAEVDAAKPRGRARPAAAPADDTGPVSCESIEALPLTTETYAGTVPRLLQVLGDRGAPADARLAALRQLGVAAFDPVEFAPFHAEFVEILRRVAEDPDSEVRAAALDRLSLGGDPVAQRLLRESLEASREPLVPAAKAVQLLGRDEHGGMLPLLRKLAASASGEVREQALRTLAADSRSAGLFERIAGNREEHPTLRRVAAINLKNVSPDRFVKLARKLLREGGDDELRNVAMAVIAHASAGDRLFGDSLAKGLASALNQVGGSRVKAAAAALAKRRKDD